MLSRERALDYVTSALGVKDAKRRLENDALGLVNEVIRKFLDKVPYQNLHMMSMKEGARNVPTVEENIECVLSRAGGACWTLNSFMFCLLKALGYHTEVLEVSVFKPGTNNHVVTLLRHVVTEGDRYLVEVGFGAPCFQAISLDFEEESETFQGSFLFYRYVKLENGLYLRKEKSVRREKEERLTGAPSKWTDRYWFNLDPFDLDLCKDNMRPVYITDTTGLLLIELRCVSFREGRCVALKNDILLLEDRDGILQPKQLATPGEVLSTIGEYFPEIPSDIALQAVENWSKYSKEPRQAEMYDSALLS